MGWFTCDWKSFDIVSLPCYIATQAISGEHVTFARENYAPPKVTCSQSVFVMTDVDRQKIPGLNAIVTRHCSYH